ncbi:MAG TPA: DUF2617 family protein [Solirubrobacteraceae bacterium]|jgi:hypothetical protein
MLVALAVAYSDVRAGDLTLALDAPRAPALEVLTRRVGGLAVELRLLGSSHQAIVEERALAETVACRPGAAGGLPARHRAPGYAFGARTVRLPASAYEARARALLHAAASDADGLAGVFPGDGTAFTALRLRPLASGVAWTTWHGYPQSGELVITHSRLGAP